jgi:glycosyltransferase involved in cell wall biosynthesis
VTHVSYSSSGGAGIVATRLSAAQAELGWSANLLTASTSDLRSAPLEHPGLTLAAAVDAYIIKKPGFPSLFSSIRDQQRSLPQEMPASDIYHLHWTNGLFGADGAEAFHRAPVVWTLHDMNPFTGGCHHSFDCVGYTDGCSGCPAVRSRFTNRPPATLEHKTALYKTWPRLHLVAPSAWLADKARSSIAFHGLPVSVIPNPIDSAFFSTPQQASTAHVAAPDDHTVIVVIAANLDDPIKNVGWAIEAFTAARVARADLSLVLVGSGGHGFAGAPGVSRTGVLTSENLIGVLDRADAILIPSLAENSPSVAYEAASRGVVPIVRNAAGLPEVLKNLGFGHTVDTSDDLITILSDKRSLGRKTAARTKKLTAAALSLTEPQRVALSYLGLYEDLL